jgi:hypothetical protein
MLHRILLAVAVLIYAGCTGDMPRGVVIGMDGKMSANSAKGTAGMVADRLKAAIEEDLGIDWRAEVRIAELPEWIEEGRIEGEGDWRWRQLTCIVRLVPLTAKPLTDAKRAELDVGIREYLDGKLVKRGQGLSVQLVVEQAAAPAPAPVPAPVAVTPGAAQPRTYVIQQGDTLADISAAFYGSAQHWRVIVAANPGLDGGALVAGTSIVIPAR